ncbi:MAG TPA: 1,4-dihydroxy-2-naphthoate polyprenyltransferase [Gemmatimonadaceae bacterium]|nr:1,4-dihydroxy-2-naphthoate polyprenyltransferase [Gemmatimonadaceae bacterium]
MTLAATKITPARAWLLASRPATLPAAAVPVVVGAAAAVSEGATFRPLVFGATLICALLIQIGTNFANDYSDFHRGADTADRLGPLRVTQSGLMKQAQIRSGIAIAFGLALIIGAGLAWIGGWPIVAIGALSVASGLAYTGGPFPLGYHALGDLFVFVFFGLVAVTGTAYLQTGSWSTFALMMSVPIGLIATAILVVNNLRDVATDRVAGKRTLAVRIGEPATRVEYALFIVFAYIVPLAVALMDPSRRPLLLTWTTFPLALGLTRRVLGGTTGRDLNRVLKQTAKLLLYFGILLAFGGILGRAA